MSKTIIIGDTHIGGSQSIGKPSDGETLNSRVADQAKILHWILNQGVLNEVERFIFTGDIFDEYKPDSKLVVIFIEWLKSCVEHGIQCHIIVGNHDMKRVGSTYQSVLDIIAAANIDGVYVYNSIYTLNTNDACYTFVPFRDKRSLSVSTVPEAVAKIKDVLIYESASVEKNRLKFLIGHFALDGAIFADEIDDVSNEIICPLTMFSGYDYIWMGHVHKPQVLSREPHIAHIGSMDISNFGETGHQKIIVLIDTESSEVFKEIEIPVRPLVRIRLDIPTDKDPTEFLVSHIKEISEFNTFNNAIVKLEIKILESSAKDIDREQVLEALNDLGVYYVSAFSESKCIAVLPEHKKDIVDETIHPKKALKKWCELQKFEKEAEDSFIEAGMEIINDCLAKGQV